MPIHWKRYACGLLTLLGCTPMLLAQVGAPVAAPAVAAPAVVAPGAAAPAAAAPGNLWSFLCPTPAQKEACRACFCRSVLGKITSGLLQPIGAFSGGLITDRCALPTAADLAKPADSAEGAAAQVKQDELDAKARRAAVRYLGTVECGRWPEAEAALINALRGDRNECVRLEAAWVLNRGCCCTPKIVAALSLTVAGSDRDGFPVERSERVRAAALAALNHCLACLAPQGPVPLGPPPVQQKGEGEKEGPGKELPAPQTLAPATLQSTAAAQAKGVLPAVAKGSGVAAAAQLAGGELRAAFYEKVTYETVAPLVQRAKALAQAQASSNAAAARQVRANGLLDIVGKSFAPTNTPAQDVIPVSNTDTPRSVEPPSALPQAHGTFSPSNSRLDVEPASRSSQVIGPVTSPYVPTSQATGNRGLIPALMNMSQGRRTTTGTEMPSVPVSLGEPAPASTIRLPARSHVGPMTSPYPVNTVPSSAAAGFPLQASPPVGSNTDVAPMAIDDILVRTAAMEK